MTNGWGDGEWHDMFWGGGAYPYDPSATLDAIGMLASYAAVGFEGTNHATGTLLSYTARGALEHQAATGVLE